MQQIHIVKTSCFDIVVVGLNSSVIVLFKATSIINKFFGGFLMKKFLTMLILGLAIFSVSCSSEKESTNFLSDVVSLYGTSDVSLSNDASVIFASDGRSFAITIDNETTNYSYDSVDSAGTLGTYKVSTSSTAMVIADTQNDTDFKAAMVTVMTESTSITLTTDGSDISSATVVGSTTSGADITVSSASTSAADGNYVFDSAESATVATYKLGTTYTATVTLDSASASASASVVIKAVVENPETEEEDEDDTTTDSTETNAYVKSSTISITIDSLEYTKAN